MDKKIKVINILSFILVICVVLSLIWITKSNAKVYADEIEQIETGGEISVNTPEQLTSTGGFDKSQGGVLIEGGNDNKFTNIRSRNDLTNVHFISNANYFLLNPKHYENDGTDNETGTCTTVAMQMLLGYHNYYSDRRLIPANNTNFLSAAHGNIEYHPNFYRERVASQGCDKIGTYDGVYEEIFDRTPLASDPTIGQNVYSVRVGTQSFIDEFAAQEAKDGVSLIAGGFSATEARQEINAGRPIVLVMNLLLQSNFHVVVAYGYAKLDGVDGFLVHYGWGDRGTLVWVPESWFGWQVTMTVDHQHDLQETGIIVKNSHRKLSCSECGYQTVELIYYNNGSTITDLRYPISGIITIPTSIDIYNTATATFNVQTIAAIGASAFENNTSITNVTIPNKIVSIGENAFSGCTALSSISIGTGVVNIGTGAFAGCNNLVFNVLPGNQNYSAAGNILYNKNKTKIIASGLISSNVNVLSTVTEIGAYAFYRNSNLAEIHISKTTGAAVVIGEKAFASCQNLKKVYFYSLSEPGDGIATNIFLSTNLDNVYVPYEQQNAYKTRYASLSSKIVSIPIVVTLKVDGATYNTINSYYGKEIQDTYSPSKSGHTFDCWQSADGKTYRVGEKWTSVENLTVEAQFTSNSYTVTLNKQSDEAGGTNSIQAVFGNAMPQASKPSKMGYEFKGYYTQSNGGGTKYYDADMQSVKNWDIASNTTLYAYWVPIEYTITLMLYDNRTLETTVCHGEQVQVNFIPSRAHYEFKGYYTRQNGQGTCYVGSEVKKVGDYYYLKPVIKSATWSEYSDGVLYAYWVRLEANVAYDLISLGTPNTKLETRTISITSGQQMTLTAPTKDGYVFKHWNLNGTTYSSATFSHTFELHRSYITGQITLYLPNPNSSTSTDGYLAVYYEQDPNCIAAGTLITLADGSKVPVETLTGNERLLVWNMNTGSFDSAAILFIDHDEAKTYRIINLYFSDGTHVKVIDEHAFWDFNLNEYVFLREDASQYIGHWFNKQITDENGNLAWTRVQLTGVTITEEYTTAWSPVTSEHLCIYVNGMLSMPGGTAGLINIFDVDSETLQIDQEQYLLDVQTYGLFTYEEFAELYPISEQMFNAVNGQYLKVAIGKGLIDYETLGEMIETYSGFFV